MNSTPSRCSSIIRLTALPPPPPTPTTFIRAFWEVLSSNSKIIAGGTPNEWREGGPKFGRNIMLSLPKRARDDRKAAVSFFGCVVGSSRDQFGWRGAGIAWWAPSLWGHGLNGLNGLNGSLGCGGRRRRAPHRRCMNDNNVFFCC